MITSNFNFYNTTDALNNITDESQQRSLAHARTPPSTYRRDVIILIVTSVIIIAINSMVIIAFGVDKKLRRRPANVLICSQASADLFTGVIFIPVYLIQTYYGKTMALLFMTCYMLFLSLFNLLTLSTDRYLALYRPLLHHRMIDVRRTVILITFIWILPLFLSLIPLCWWFQPVVFKMNADRIFLGIVWSFMLVLVVAMTILYVCVTLKAKRTIRTKRQTISQRAHIQIASLARKELRVVHLFGLLLVFFVAAYLPILYMNFCDMIGEVKYIPMELEIISFYSLILNSIVNPVLCIYLKKDFLQVISKLIGYNGSRFRDLSIRSTTNQTQYECENEFESREHSRRNVIELSSMLSTSQVNVEENSNERNAKSTEKDITTPLLSLKLKTKSEMFDQSNAELSWLTIDKIPSAK